MTALVVIFSFIIVAFMEIYVKKILKEDSINVGKALVTAMALHIVDPLLINDFVALDNYSDEIMKANTEIAYIFIEKDGQVLLHTFREGFPKNLLNIGHRKDTVDYMNVRTDKGLFLDFSVPIYGGRAGMLRVGFDERI